MDEQVMDEPGRAAKQALLHSSFYLIVVYEAPEPTRRARIAIR